MILFEYRVVVPSNDRKFLVKGTELNNAIVPETGYRFQICEIRCYGADGFPDRRYEIRDAHTVSDADVKAGKRPLVVFRGDTEQKCLEFCLTALQ